MTTSTARRLARRSAQIVELSALLCFLQHCSETRAPTGDTVAHGDAFRPLDLDAGSQPDSPGPREWGIESGADTDGPETYPVPPPKPINLTFTLGCTYMPKPTYPSHQWSELFAFNRLDRIKELHGQRVPVLGYYQGDSPVALDWQIKFAVDRGITFFIFDDYWTESSDQPNYSTSIDAFLAAKYSGQMQFAVNLVNNNTVSSSKIDRFLQVILPYYVNHYFSKPNYLVVEGRPYLQVHNLSGAFGTSDSAAIKGLMAAADQYIAGNTPYSGAYWAKNADHATGVVDFSTAKNLGFDAVAPYYEVKYLFPNTGKSQWPIDIADPNINKTWPVGVEYSEQQAHFIANNKLAFAEAKSKGIHFLSACSPDFDYRTYHWVTKQLYFVNHDRVAWWDMVSELKKNVDSNPSVLPTCTNTGKKMVGIGPWNEQVEAISIEPAHTPFNDASNMDPFFVATAVAKIFGGPQTYPIQQPSKPVSRGWPTKASWTFDHLTGAGLDHWHHTVNSVLETDSDNTAVLAIDSGSAQLKTATWLNAADYSKVKVRLKVLSGGPIQMVTFDWYSSTHSGKSSDFLAPGEPGKLLHTVVLGNTGNYQIVSGYREYSWDLAANSKWQGTVFYLTLRVVTQAADNPVYPIKVKIDKIWFEK